MVATVILVVLLLWLAPAVMCAFTAGGKNRSAAGWLIVGLFFGLLGFLILLCLPKGEASEPRPPRAVAAPSAPSKDPFNRG